MAGRIALGGGFRSMGIRNYSWWFAGGHRIQRRHLDPSDCPLLIVQEGSRMMFLPRSWASGDQTTVMLASMRMLWRDITPDTSTAAPSC